MEIRRVQRTGGSSYVLTLPKEWVQSLHLSKKDPLGVLVKENGDLLITGNISGDIIPRKKQFDIEPNIDPDLFFRCLVGIYIGGFNSIEIRSHERISALIRRKVRDFSDQVVGLEPVEEEEDYIILRDLFNPLEMPFEQSLKRMYTITRGMHIDATMLLSREDTSLALDIISRDRDVDRLFWLISRQTNIILHSPRIGRNNTPIGEVLHYYQMGRIIERIADHALLTVQSLQNLDFNLVNSKIRKTIETAYSGALKSFDKSIEAYFSTDVKRANQIIESVHLHEDVFHQINREILSLPTEPALYIRKISDSIRRVGEYSDDIAEEVINFHTSMGRDKE